MADILEFKRRGAAVPAVIPSPPSQPVLENPASAAPRIAWTITPGDEPEFDDIREARDYTRLLEDLRFVAMDLKAVSDVRDRLEAINAFIAGLADFVPSERTVAIRREGLEGASLQDLCTIIVQSDERVWKTKPNYFGAVTLEYTYRVDRVIRQFPESGE